MIPFIVIGAAVVIVGYTKFRDTKRKKTYTHKKQTEMDKPSDEAYEKATKTKSLGGGGQY